MAAKKLSNKPHTRKIKTAKGTVNKHVKRSRKVKGR